MKKAGKENGFRHSIERQESNFDRASDSAYQLALMIYGADDNGYLLELEGNDRTRDSIAVEFEKYIRIGHSHIYTFFIWVDRADDDDDDDDDDDEEYGFDDHPTA